MNSLQTIVAPATPPGVSAIAIVRLSGTDSIEIVQKVFKGKNLTEQLSHSIHFGKIVKDNQVIDEVMVSVFREPSSFTKENSVEISCHGSPLIVGKIIQVLIDSGARMASPGEFTKRAFLNKRFDLTQAEAVAGLIHAENEVAHKAAMHQMRGGFKKELEMLRQELIHFASLVELELDFGEEDVEFVKRDELKNMVLRIQSIIQPLIESFRIGNVVKNGIRTVIAGKPNSGKSTLLNALLNEERSIVSEIPGTTRDVIEDVIHMDGIAIRFIDTAGLRDARDPIESIGINKTHQEIQRASLVLYLIDLSETSVEEIGLQESKLKEFGIPYLLVGNKVDRADKPMISQLTASGCILISALEKKNLQTLKNRITTLFKTGIATQDGTLITNWRHYENLEETNHALHRVIQGLDTRLSGDFIALDIRQALFYLGLITGEISTEDLLESIFSKFCIGK